MTLFLVQITSVIQTNRLARDSHTIYTLYRSGAGPVVSQAGINERVSQWFCNFIKIPCRLLSRESTQTSGCLKMADLTRLLLGILKLSLVLCLFPVPISSSLRLLNNSYDFIAQQFGISKVPRMTFPSEVSNQCIDSFLTLLGNPQNLTALCEYNLQIPIIFIL